MKKRRLDQCQQYVVFERSAKQVSSPERSPSTPSAVFLLHVHNIWPPGLDPARNTWVFYLLSMASTANVER
jgi:hypothetical protein